MVFDATGVQQLTLRAIEDTYTFFGLFPPREEMQLLMLRYDKDGDGRLSWEEFSSMFLPRDQHY